METLPNGEPSEQPAAEPVTQPAGEQPQQGDTASQLEGLSQEELYQVLESANTGEAPRQPQAPAAPAAEAEPTETPPANEPEPEPGSEGTEAPPAAGDDTPQAPKPINRLSVRSLPPEQQTQLAQALELVREGKAADITSALAFVTGKPVIPAPAATPPQEQAVAEAAPTQEAPPAAPQGDVAGIQDRIKDLREQRRQAIKDFDRETEAKLTEDIEDLQVELVRAEQAAQRQQVESRSYNDAYAKAVEAVEAKYEAAKDDNSAFARILDDKVAAAHARKDPVLADPNFIVRFADDVAADLGLNKGTPAPPPPVRQARPVGSFAPGHMTTDRLSPEAARKLIHEVPIEDLQKVAFTE